VGHTIRIRAALLDDWRDRARRGFALTLNVRLSAIVIGSSFVVYFLVVPLIKKRAGAQR
jgi:hypothetical protein